MGRPSMSRSIKRRRLRALDQAADVPGQLNPTHLGILGSVSCQKPKRAKSDVAAPKKTAKKRAKASRNFGRKSK